MADHPFHLFGIRHHGPGCARSLVQALQTLQPDCLLVEGPPEANELIALVNAPTMRPPVALLVYHPDQPRQSVFYPFAEYSPEWQALRFAQGQGVSVHFMDLPMQHRFGMEDDDQTLKPNADGEPTTELSPAAPDKDPLDWLADAAGYPDGETWWNHLIEERGQGAEVFEAIAEMMTALRQEFPDGGQTSHTQSLGLVREAYMRKCMREAQKQGYQRIAVVCGAWHLPALQNLPSAKSDNELLRGLPKSKAVATWAPWSNRQIGAFSGYGAGVMSPGWYEHIWHTPEAQRGIAWLSRVARLFRQEDLDCSSAHIIEAVRLADTLANMRGRGQAGLDELRDAIRSVICMGDDAGMDLIEKKMVVGDRLGSVPDDAPAVPLLRDLNQLQKTLRLKPQATQELLDLDLRQDKDLARSQLLHRLRLLEIDWGQLAGQGKSSKGTFHEIWTLQWQAEWIVRLITASRFGNTVESAASNCAVDKAKQATDLSVVSQLIQQVMLAQLPDAIEPVSDALGRLAAVATDVQQLLASVAPLVNIVRYGNVRQTDTRMVSQLLDTLVLRVCLNLSIACQSLDDEAASHMRQHIAQADGALKLLGHDTLYPQWQQSLRGLTQFGLGHGLVSGLASRLLFDQQADDLELTAKRMNLALSPGNDPAAAAAWLEGFLNQSALVLLHDDALWNLVNGWLESLSEAHFVRVIPLLRRSFASFSNAERRQIGERAQQGTQQSHQTQAAQQAWNEQRAQMPVPLLRQLLGLPI